MKSASFGILSDEVFARVGTLRESTQQVVAGNSLRMYAGKRSFPHAHLNLLEGLLVNNSWQRVFHLVGPAGCAQLGDILLDLRR